MPRTSGGSLTRMGRCTKMGNKILEFIGWLLFTVSAIGFCIASIGSFWGMFGSVFFLVACIIFLIPFFRKDDEQ